MSEDFPELRAETKRMIEGHETKDTEFKESESAVDQESIVAFANAKGGTILVGVKETKDATGMQCGKIIGCTKNFDDIRLAIQDRANHCQPPVKVTIVRECDGSKMIYRIDIAEASQKPCCTGNGRYVKRQSGQKVPIYPDEMMGVILEREGQKFIKQLEDAGAKFLGELKKGQEELHDQIQDVERVVDDAVEAAQDAAAAAEKAEEAAGDAADAAREAADYAEEAAEKD